MAIINLFQKENAWTIYEYSSNPTSKYKLNQKWMATIVYKYREEKECARKAEPSWENKKLIHQYPVMPNSIHLQMLIVASYLEMCKSIHEHKDAKRDK